MNCCHVSKKSKKCIRKPDNKEFNLPRKFTKKQCKYPRGFTMRASCAPWKYCHKGGKKTKKSFLYNPNNPKKSFDVYIDKNPKDTIPIKYKTINDVNATIKKLENLYKKNKYSHKRIWQVAMIMRVRLNVLKNSKPKQYQLANRYYNFLKKRTKLSETERKKLVFR